MIFIEVLSLLLRETGNLKPETRQPSEISGYLQVSSTNRSVLLILYRIREIITPKMFFLNTIDKVYLKR